MTDKTIKTRILVFSVLNLVFYVVAGAQNGLAGRNIFTMLPYGALSLPTAFLLMAAVRLIRRGDEKAADRVKMCGTMAIVLGGLCAVAGFILSVSNGWPPSGADAVFIGTTLGCAFEGFSAFREARALKPTGEDPGPKD
ncbi:MAG: hypothetical protein LBI19_09080 [Oscillospiraceae bacterium]|jgi:Zn-dependent protease with chaperone function|nr:hypothetical protein [Oscillospiraceae bacterium]